MSVAPTIGWESVNCTGAPFWWQGQGIGGQPANPIAVVKTSSGAVHFVAGTSGSVAFTVTGTVTQGSNAISSVSSTTDLVVGQFISGPGIPAYSWISNVGSTVTFQNGWINSPANDQSATASGTVTLLINDPCPIGSLAVIVTPSTGITITDMNADGTGNVAYVSNGAAMANLMGEAEADFEVAFASTGTFSVTVAFTTADPNYQNVTLSPSIVFALSS